MPNKAQIEGFGFIPSESEHHFLVTISSNKKDSVYISEHFTWDESEPRRELSFALGREDNKMRVILPRQLWDAIAEDVKAEFNRELRKIGLKAGQWKIGQTPLSRLLGKELVLLCWSIEDADPALITTAIKNWRGLVPEERWWLFTMTNAVTGHAISGRNQGWRKAVRYALTENAPQDRHPHTLEMTLFSSVDDEMPWVSPSSPAMEDEEHINSNASTGEK